MLQCDTQTRFVIFYVLNFLRPKYKLLFQGNEVDWAIYFNDLHLPEYDMLQYVNSARLGSGDFILTHVDGGLFKLRPTIKFEGK